MFRQRMLIIKFVTSNLPLLIVSSNLVSAGVRLIPIGQTMSLKVLAGLADTILTVKEISLTSSPKNMGSATLVVDWTSARHETQYTRLFRS